MSHARRGALIGLLAIAACSPPAHRFTSVVTVKPSPGGTAVAAEVWDERGAGKPHFSGVVVAARGADLRDAEPVLVARDDFHPIAFDWTGPAALTLRLPCGRWSSLANHAIVAGATVTIAVTPPRGCYVRHDGTGALPGDNPVDSAVVD